VIELLISTIHF